MSAISEASRALGAQAAPLAARVVAGVRQLPQQLTDRVVPYLSRRLQYVGRTGVVGIGLLVVAAAFFVGANSPLKIEVAELQASLDTTRRSSADDKGRKAPSPVDDVQEFVRALPPRSELPAITERIVGEAAAAQIALERGAYDSTATQSGHFIRARMSFPVHGRYLDIRRFVNGVLVAVPEAAIDGLRLERKDIASAEIDAEIRFAVYLRNSP